MAIERVSENVPAGAMEVVKGFLVCTLDVPDEGKARGMLSKGSQEEGAFHMPESGGKGSYVIGEGTVEGGQVFVAVTLKDSGTGAEMTMPLAPVLEEGVWKLDMGKMMEKLMGGSMGRMVEQIGSAMGDMMGAAMEGIGEAMKEALGGDEKVTRGDEDVMPAVAAGDVAGLEKKVAEVNEELSGRNDLSVRVEVDVAGLLRGESEEENRKLAGKIGEEVLRNFVWAVMEAHREVALEGRVKVIRLEGVREARERVVFAEGARIIYRLSVKEEGGFYEGQALAEILKGAAAGMAESALPGEVERKPSFKPSGEGEKIVKDYREFVVPALLKRVGEMLGHGVELEVDWELLAGNAEDAKAFWMWGLNRIVGGIGVLVLKEENRTALSEGIEKVEIRTVPYEGMKAIEVNGKTLLMYFSPGDGEKGGFYEGEVAERVSGKLKLRTRPMIAELERYAKTWEKQLGELFGASIQYAFDWDGFTCQEEEGKNVFALTLLREHGVDGMFYALSKLAGANPNFKQQVPKRVRWIYLEHAARAELKGLRGEETTLALKVFLHEGYAGYLTMKEMEQALPGIVAGMPDIVEEVAAKEMVGGDEGELAELRKWEEELAALKEWTAKGVERFSAAMEKLVGNRLKVVVAWETFAWERQGMKELVERVLQGVVEGLGMVAQQEGMKSAMAAMLDEVVIRDGTEQEEEEGFLLEARVLTYTVIRKEGKKVIEPEEAVRLICEAMGAVEVVESGEVLMNVEAGVDPNERTPQPYVAVSDGEAEKGAAELKEQYEGMLPAFAQQLTMVLGRRVGFEIEWKSVRGGMAGMGQLLNAGLTPVVGGLAMLVNDVGNAEGLGLILKVVLREAGAANEHGFSLKEGVLTYSAVLTAGMPMMEAQLAGVLLKTVLRKAGLAKRVGARAKGKGSTAVKKKAPKKK